MGRDSEHEEAVGLLHSEDEAPVPTAVPGSRSLLYLKIGLVVSLVLNVVGLPVLLSIFKDTKGSSQCPQDSLMYSESSSSHHIFACSSHGSTKD